jgi:hypothetical protein
MHLNYDLGHSDTDYSVITATDCITSLIRDEIQSSDLFLIFSLFQLSDKFST